MHTATGDTREAAELAAALQLSLQEEGSDDSCGGGGWAKARQAALEAEARHPDVAGGKASGAGGGGGGWGGSKASAAESAGGGDGEGGGSSKASGAAAADGKASGADASGRNKDGDVRLSKYYCPDCREPFAKWALCLQHLKAANHADVNVSTKGLQQRCMTNYVPPAQDAAAAGQVSSDTTVLLHHMVHTVVRPGEQVLPAEIVARRGILRLLLEHSGSMLTSAIPPAYQQMFGTALGYKEFGYKKLQKMLESIQGVAVHEHSCVLTDLALEAEPDQTAVIDELCRMIQAAGGSMPSSALAALYKKLPVAKATVKSAGNLAGLCSKSGGRLTLVVSSVSPGSDVIHLGTPEAVPAGQSPAKAKIISTQTCDGAMSVAILRSMASTFRGRVWPGTKTELKSAVFAAKIQNADGMSLGTKKDALGTLTSLWKASACLVGKGTKKHTFVWNQAAIEQVLGLAPAASTQPPASDHEASSNVASPIRQHNFELVDTADKLVVATQAITDCIRASASSTVPVAEPEPEPVFWCSSSGVSGVRNETDSPRPTERKVVIAIGTKSGAEDVSLVQLATSELAYLFDCVSLTTEAVATALAPLCGDPAVTKVAFDIHQAAHVLGSIGFAGTVDVQLAIELLTGDPSHSQSECIAQLQPERQKTRQPQRATADPSFDARPLPATARARAANEVQELLGIWPRLLEAVGSDLAGVQKASDLRAMAGALSGTGSRRIIFDAANSYAIASPELLQVMRPRDAHVPDQLIVSNDTKVLLDLLPTDIGNELRHTDEGAEDLTLLLSDIVLDKGRQACAWIDGIRRPLGADGRVVGVEDIAAVLDALGGFGSDDRAGLEQQLHRISCMRNRYKDVIGLTMRVGRHVSGNADMISDLLFGDDRSILFLGEPGSGKTTIVREATRLLSMESNVCVVDTSNEIAGDGDVPHPCIGLARRMMVPSLDDQAAVMVQCVQNHTPEIMVIDEIGRSPEVEAARTCKQRGVRMIASAHGDLRKLVKNKQLRSLIGGVESVTLGDVAAKAEGKKSGFGGMQKVKPQRSGPATFDVIVELRRGEQHEWRIIMDAGKARPPPSTRRYPFVWPKGVLNGS